MLRFPLVCVLTTVVGWCVLLGAEEQGSGVKTPESSVSDQEKDPDEEQKEKQATEVDVLKEVLAINSEKFASPPTEFRKGHVKPRKLDPKSIQQTDNGFVVQLPSKAPVATPVVYDGKVYVSGGFSSKQFYCFEASSGELVWGLDLDDDGPSTAACADGKVVFNTESCTIFVVDAKTGKHIWSYWLGDPLTTSPTVANGMVFTSYPAGSALGNLNGGGQQGNANPFGPPPVPNEPNEFVPPIPGGDVPPNPNAPTVKPAPAVPDPPALPPVNDPPVGDLPPQAVPQQSTNANPQIAPPQQATPPVVQQEAQQNDEPALQQQVQGQLPGRGLPEKDKDGKPYPKASHVLVAFDLQTGKILWQRWIDSDVMTAPVAVDGELYVTTFAGTVLRVKQKTGKILSAKRSRATSAPVVVGNDVYVTQRADNKQGQVAQEQLSKLDRNVQNPSYKVNQKQADYLDKNTQAKSQLATKGQQLDAGNGFGGGAPAAANPLAAAENVGQGGVALMQGFQGSRILVQGTSTFTCMGNELVCNHRVNGRKLWSVELKGDLKKVGGSLGAPPASAGGHLFLATLDGRVLQIEPEKGNILKTYQVGAPIRFQPVIEHGRIFVGTQDGKLVCIDTKNPKLTGWSHWGGNAARTGIASERETE